MLALIHNCLEAQELLTEYRKDAMSKKAMIDEFCTVKISGPRMSGHTTAIKRLVEQYNSWVFFRDANLLRRFSGAMPVDSFNINSTSYIGLELPACIFIDNASVIPKKKIEKLIKCLQKNYVKNKKLCIVYAG